MLQPSFIQQWQTLRQDLEKKDTPEAKEPEQVEKDQEDATKEDKEKEEKEKQRAAIAAAKKATEDAKKNLVRYLWNGDGRHGVDETMKHMHLLGQSVRRTSILCT